MKTYTKKLLSYCFFVCVFTAHTSYGQTNASAPGGGTVATQAVSPGQQSADTTASPQAKETDTSQNLCVPGEDSSARIIHFPYIRWTDFSSKMRIAQETINTVGRQLGEVQDFFKEEFLGREGDDSAVDQENRQAGIVEERAMRAFALIKLIRKYPRAVVFHEFVTRIQNERALPPPVSKEGLWGYSHIEDLPDVEHRNLKHLFYVSRIQFPMGVPKEYADLDKEQKYILAVIGGVHTLFFLGELPIVFPALSRADYQRALDISHLDPDYASPEQKHKFYHETLFCDYDEICTVKDDKIRILKTEYLSKAVNNFLNAFPPDDGTNDDFEKQMLILAYDGGMNLQPYFPNKEVFRVPDSCLSPPAPVDKE